jgi:basic membrane protein A
MKHATSVVRLLVVLAAAFCLALAAPASAAAQNQPVKVAFIYVGPVGDAGWSFSHDQGRKYLEKNLPGVKTAFVESVPEGADAERILTQFARDGYKVIFATSFGYMDAVINVAKRFPDVRFEHCSGFKTAPNASTYFGRIYEARYLSGIVAGRMTKSSLIGYVAAHPIPEVIRGINAFTMGARSVNPGAKVRVVWTNTWYNPASEKEAAKALLDAGCDVIAQHQDTPGPMQAAEERGKYGISYNSPMMQFAPKAVLTGPVWNWGPYYVKRVKAAMDGTWKTGQYWGPMADGIVDLAPFNKAVPADVVKLVNAKKRDIVRGRLHPFAGPVKDSTGKGIVPAGKTLSDAEMLSFNWFVEGVEGTLPKK